MNRTNLDELIRRTREGARSRIVKSGKVEFRMEPADMIALLEIAKVQQTGYGVLARTWILERLEREKKKRRPRKSSVNRASSSSQTKDSKRKARPSK